MSRFGDGLIQSAREALAIAEGRLAPGVIHVPDEIDVKAIRARTRLSQESFARRFGLSPSALRDWEQKRRQPDRVARILLQVIDRHPEAVEDVLSKSVPTPAP